MDSYEIRQLIIGMVYGIAVWLWIYRPLIGAADILAITFLKKPETPEARWLKDMPAWVSVLRWLSLGALVCLWWR